MRPNDTTRTHTISAARTALGASARKTPPEVATPLPPRKPTQNEKTCPTMAAAPYASAHVQAVEPSSWGNRNTGSHPLATSTTITGRAAFQPRTRNVLVAPRLPLPISRRSTPYA